MRKFAAVTTFHNTGYEEYGRRMIETFDRMWPAEVELHVYHESVVPELVSPRVHYRDLHATCPDLVAFKERHRDNPRANGKEDRGPMPGKKANQRVGIGFLWDAVRFAHKTYCIFDAAQRVDADVLFWIDADTHTFAPVPLEFVQGVLPDQDLVCYLGRVMKYTECGFVGYNLRHPMIGDFMARFKALYDTDALLEQPEWHDSFLFDVIRLQMETEGATTHNLTGNFDRLVMHPFINSELGAFLDHCKGQRKAEGRSKRSDLVVQRNEDYWKTAR